MKYMTADLIARFRSADESIADPAADEWDRACAAYNSRIESIKDRLPASARQLLEGPCLHDAKFLTAFEDTDSFFILLKLDNPPQKIELKYKLAGGMESLDQQRHSQLEGDGKPWQWVLYDEIDVTCEEDAPIFTHSILLTGGWELKVRFRDLACLPVRRVLSPDMLSVSGGSPEADLAACT